MHLAVVSCTKCEYVKKQVRIEIAVALEDCRREEAVGILHFCCYYCAAHDSGKTCKGIIPRYDKGIGCYPESQTRAL
jgi:hypothetical protein